MLLYSIAMHFHECQSKVKSWLRDDPGYDQEKGRKSCITQAGLAGMIGTKQPAWSGPSILF